MIGPPEQGEERRGRWVLGHIVGWGALAAAFILLLGQLGCCGRLTTDGLGWQAAPQHSFHHLGGHVLRVQLSNAAILTLLHYGQGVG